MKPLRKMALDIKQIESGQKNKLSKNYPIELRGLSHNLNTLIETEKQQRERYHNTLADLAHSLKTPLAVIQAELESDRGANDKEVLINEQSKRMQEIITHQLQRAVIATPNQLRNKISVAEPIKKINGALTKVYADKNISIEQEVATNTTFQGDQRDLMEIVGNITDNACKACNRSVEIKAHMNGNKLIIEIHDDGPGIPKEQQAHILKRGQRLDSMTSGQGIGLDVVRDIIISYEGELEIHDSPLGGALFRMVLPG